MFNDVLPSATSSRKAHHNVLASAGEKSIRSALIVPLNCFPVSKAKAWPCPVANSMNTPGAAEFGQLPLPLLSTARKLGTVASLEHRLKPGIWFQHAASDDTARLALPSNTLASSALSEALSAAHGHGSQLPDSQKFPPSQAPAQAVPSA